MRHSIPLVVVLTVLLAGCGDDSSSDTLATNSTTASTTASTTSSTTSTTTSAPSGSSSTTSEVGSTTTAPDDGAVAAGRALLAMASGVTPMDIASCSSAGESSLNLSATDDDGDTLEVKARNDVGVITYRGPHESREGTTVRVTVGADKGFNVVGGLDGEELTLTGRCT